MLKLKDITKQYITGDTCVNALRGVSIEFRQSEFVSILGQSGCGKTTLLNIIGGLDKYTSGDLIINGVSTKEYKDSDWDTYRNHSIGFVFQSYNLIPHQSVLSNVELALTLSGVSKAERKRRAIEALERVGLGDQIHKKPNQMSGGQMQRVAIARALVNNPDILLADEPTGALDSETSVQIMNILKEISKDKLIIMVTHNPDLANEYSTRIINLLDGVVISDSNPYTASEEIVGKHNAILSFENEEPYVAEGKVTDIKVKTKKVKKKAVNKKKKKSMSFLTALSLSLNNLLTKKSRTFLTSFAGSIGIIGIALILSVSTGVNSYITSVEESTMSSYPLTFQETTMDASALLASFLSNNNSTKNQDPNKIYSNDIMTSVIEGVNAGITNNNLKLFKAYIEASGIREHSVDIKYNYSAHLNTYWFNTDENGKLTDYHKTYENLGDLMIDAGIFDEGMAGLSSMMGGSPWTELIGNDEYIKSQYDLIDGHFPENGNQIVLIVDSNKQITDYILYSLGIKDIKVLEEYVDRMAEAKEKGEEFTEKLPQTSYTFDDIYGYRFKVLLDSDFYEYVEVKDANGNVISQKIIDRTNQEVAENKSFIDKKMENARELEIVGIICAKESSVTATTVGSIGYTTSLMTAIINDVNGSDVVTSQLNNDKTNLFTGFEFKGYTLEMAAALREQLKNNPAIAPYLGFLTDEQLIEMVNEQIGSYKGNLKKLGYVDFESPSSILIYPKDFESKDAITDLITDYNNNATKENKITYTDTVALLMSSVTTIINAISYVLIAFVAISLIVSSIMIGVITLISVQERTKEIGVLRAIGASKKDVSRVFNAETLIVGFGAGALGILLSLALIVIINIILYSLTELETLKAVLPWGAALILVAISMGLTLISGIIPSRAAAKKDPVIALRTE
ncbi:MAG: ABC transporter ATP-binding protein/permease [Clostridia bacterium]|nr:ABC transporter ATP-binding protein/permease [Clostridia bacterium]